MSGNRAQSLVMVFVAAGANEEATRSDSPEFGPFDSEVEQTYTSTRADNLKDEGAKQKNIKTAKKPKPWWLTRSMSKRDRATSKRMSKGTITPSSGASLESMKKRKRLEPGDDAHLMAAKKEVEETFERTKWELIARNMKRRGGAGKYSTTFLEKKARKLDWQRVEREMALAPPPSIPFPAFTSAHIARSWTDSAPRTAATPAEDAEEAEIQAAANFLLDVAMAARADDEEDDV